MFCDWMNVLKVFSLSLDLLGQPVIAHICFDRYRSMYDHSANFCSLFICGCMCCMLSIIIARSSLHVVVVHVKGDVLKWYPMLSYSSHFRSGSKNMINRYGLRVSLYIVPRLISIGSVDPKWFSVNDVVDFLSMFPTISIISIG